MAPSGGNKHKCKLPTLGIYILPLTSMSEGLAKQQEEQLKELSGHLSESKPNKVIINGKINYSTH